MRSLWCLSLVVVSAACVPGCGTARSGLVTRAPGASTAAVGAAAGSLQAVPASGVGLSESPTPAASTPEPGLAHAPALGPADAPVAEAPGAGLGDVTPAGAPPPDLAALALRETALPDAPVGALARAALVPHPGLAITLRDGLEIAPLGGPPRRGVVFYPGGNVDPRAYAPLARAWALAGYLVCIPAMPRRMAIFAPNRASDVMARHPAVSGWVVGGHSLGGVAASLYASWHPRRVSGLMMLATVPGPFVDLSRRTWPALSVYGTHDPRVPLVEIAATARRLPPASRLIGITGANHGQFGDYGPHPRDAEAAITRAEQHSRIIEATRAWLDALPAP
ncbi:MAG: alpha/beta hydrolase [Candidatus Sericytochromatia bacterium]|nr:alpha/beta hydrolase [Candidatus Sericytochromatia bacterium]